MAVAARTIDETLGRLSQRVAVKVKPEDVPLNLRGEGVTTHTMRLTWGPPIRYWMHYPRLDCMPTFIIDPI